MTDYRGVSSTEVARSLTAACQFLKSLSLGPASDARLDRWAEDFNARKISELNDGVAVAQAMRETGTLALFGRFAEVLRHHGQLDTDGDGERVFRDLSRWGGLAGPVKLTNGAIDREADIHLIQQYSSLLSGQVHIQPMAYHFRMEGALDKVSPERRDQLDQQLQALVTKGFARDNQGIAADIAATSPQTVTGLKRIMYYVSGLSTDAEHVKAPQLFARYGIAVDESAYASTNDAEEAKCDIADAAHGILDHYAQRDEVLQAGLGTITDDGKKAGLTFISTRRAAQALADNFNQLQVIDNTGQQVLPSANNAAKPGFSSPQP